ncbi:hypothetical protein HBI81_246100 [Parastagonospora nodorum]|nr:hypothetical protein HBH52_074210 [Parastagonospora nodorum]KAH4082877.1 hypothetical protein HBH46_219880 [Parastagonospora nodorum]KAH5483744.1 hypothetical protein HBI31_174120 [Parastagonospora nodorum]KAH5711447.1 hypothetical protein HBI18_219710 [Parastagonospora nodorum]KAH5728879.1 hypothetical protein HBI17_225590 [Parastagonospora nodorum]
MRSSIPYINSRFYVDATYSARLGPGEMIVVRLACRAAYAWTAFAKANYTSMRTGNRSRGKFNSESREQTVTTQDSEDLILDSARVRANLNGERSPLAAGPKASS